MRAAIPVLLSLALAAGCGGGGDAGVRETASRAPSAPPATSATAGPTASPTAATKHGSATVTYRGVSAAWAERGCQATRDLDGKVVGWMATFQAPEEIARRHQMGITESRSYVTIRLRGGYTGAGTYPSERVSVRLQSGSGTPYATGFEVPGQRLVLREGGRAGTYTSKDATVDFTCDPADDTSTERGAAIPATPSAGNGYVVRNDGAAFTFDQVRCARTADGTSITAGAFPHFFRVLTSAKEGSPAGGRVLFAVHGVVLSFAGQETRVEVSGDPAASGTFRYSPSGPDATTNVTRGAFVCG